MHPTDNGRKLEDKHENPIDNFLYIFVNKLTPIFHKLGLTPNNITFLSFLCALISFYFFCKKEYRLAALFWGINYFFDAVDGYMARKYKMFSKYGDYYTIPFSKKPCEYEHADFKIRSNILGDRIFYSFSSEIDNLFNKKHNCYKLSARVYFFFNYYDNNKVLKECVM